MIESCRFGLFLFLDPHDEDSFQKHLIPNLHHIFISLLIIWLNYTVQEKSPLCTLRKSRKIGKVLFGVQSTVCRACALKEKADFLSAPNSSPQRGVPGTKFPTCFKTAKF